MDNMPGSGEKPTIQVSIPLLKWAAISDILTPRDALLRCNGLFDVQMVGPTQEVVRIGNIHIQPSRSASSRQAIDLIIVPSLGLELTEGIQDNQWVVSWLRRHAKANTVIASWCTGAFLLAASGLLNGRCATTHWAASPPFRQWFPSVQLAVEQLLVDEGQFITAGGSTSVYQLIIYLLHRFAGAELALAKAREFLVNTNRPSQNAYADLRLYYEHSNDVVATVQQFIVENLHTKLTLEILASQVGTSARNLTRIFEKAIGISPIAFVQMARVHKAKDKLALTTDSFEAITYQVGYHDPRSFRRLFRKITGQSPRAYRTMMTLLKDELPLIPDP